VTPEKPVTSYLTPLTGVTRDLLESEGMPLAAALVELRRSLPPSAVLVGQNILKDVQVLVLVNASDIKFMRNIDYACTPSTRHLQPFRCDSSGLAFARL